MNATLDAVLHSWPFEPWLVLSLLIAAFVYVRGWIDLRHRDPLRWQFRSLGYFVAALITLFLAIASPIEAFTSLLLQAHMAQHLLLMMVVPPLFWLGAPMFPMVRGLPVAIRAYWLVPILRSRPLRRVFTTLTYPLCSLAIFLVTTWFWHAPPVYEHALSSSQWHMLEHLCFLGSGLLFWYPVIRPYPSRPRWSLWLLLPYLIVADVSNTLLSALLTFSSRVLYPYYEHVPRLAGLSALDDQSGAGVLMWVPGSVAYLVPLFLVGFQLIAPQARQPRARTVIERTQTSSRLPINLPVINPPRATLASSNRVRFNLLTVPLLGLFLRWRHARTSFQLVLAALALIVIADGLFGPQVAPMNLAGVLPWIHWRGLLIVGLMGAGNLFCMACPFTLPRNLARRWFPARYRWPAHLRGKWVAIALLLLFFWAYEALSLWDSPWITASIAISYFVLAFFIDSVFRGASFCKYVCPIGQFNFIQSLVSPLEVKVLEHATCGSCKTKDCIRGNDSTPGCEMGLYLPRKSGNLDCTFCLDCIHACPYHNIGIVAVVPGAGLSNETRHSGIGRPSKRPDLAVLIVLLVFGAFANAAGMVAPVVNWQDRLNVKLGLQSLVLSATLFSMITLILLPTALMSAAAIASRFFARLDENVVSIATRFSYAFVPLGFSMWLAHYSFHFVTSYSTAIPAAQRFIADLGWPFLGFPEWACSCCGPVPWWLPRFEILCLDIGWLMTLYAGYRIASKATDRPARAVKALGPWAVLSAILFAAGIWIIHQPMQMRGTMP